MVAFGQKCLYSGKSCCIRVSGCNRRKLVVCGQSGFVPKKLVVFKQKGLYSDKVIVIGQKLLYSGVWL